MNCPECDRKMQVYETRVVGEVVYRRRHCAHCDDTIVTKEEIADVASIPSTGRPIGRPKKPASAAVAHNPFGL